MNFHVTSAIERDQLKMSQHNFLPYRQRDITFFDDKFSVEKMSESSTTFGAFVHLKKKSDYRCIDKSERCAITKLIALFLLWETFK